MTFKMLTNSSISCSLMPLLEYMIHPFWSYSLIPPWPCVPDTTDLIPQGVALTDKSPCQHLCFLKTSVPIDAHSGDTTLLSSLSDSGPAITDNFFSKWAYLGSFQTPALLKNLLTYHSHVESSHILEEN